MSKKQKNIYIVSAIIFTIVVFYAGMKYDASTQTKPAMSGFSGGKGSGRGGFGMGQGMTAGNIVSIDSQSITLKTRDGSSKVILIGSSTPVTKSVPGTITDLNPGDNVTILGKTNSDGSVAATEIQERNRPQVQQ